MKEFAQSVNQSALDFYAKIREEKGNLLFSPLSISTALLMTYAGARGETAAQMATVFHVNSIPAEKLHPAASGLAALLNATTGAQISVANKLWSNDGFKIEQGFIELTRNSYHAEFERVNFAFAEEARAKINTWVETQTQGKIKDVMPPGVLNELTRMVLINAVYFKGSWKSKFKPEATHDADFHLDKKKIVRVAMMLQTASFGYFELNDDFKLLDLPYADDTLSMTILLPASYDGLAKLEKGLSAENLNNWLKNLLPTRVAVSLPKFMLTYSKRLNDPLIALGMREAFDKNKADFSGIGVDPLGPLYITDVFHKAFIDVNEEGTEAAAATAVVAAGRGFSSIPQFVADHPFVFLIRDKRTGAILFMGRVVNPANNSHDR